MCEDRRMHYLTLTLMLWQEVGFTDINAHFKDDGDTIQALHGLGSGVGLQLGEDKGSGQG